MKRNLTLGIFLLALVVAIVPAASQESKRCDHAALACVKHMTEQFENKGWVGIELDYSDRKAPRIVKVIPGSPAEEAGLEAGDVVVSFAGVDYATATEDELRAAKEVLLPGKEIVIGVRRGASELDLTVHAERIPEGVLAQWIGSHLLHAHQHEIAAVDTP